MSTRETQFFGLTNGGATCWLNATYQALTSLDPLMEVLLRISLEMNSAHLMLAQEINTRLVAKFFSHGQAPVHPGIPDILARADPPMRETFIRLSSIIDTLSNPESFYASAQMKEFARDIATLPLATCALICYGQESIDTSRDDSRADAALRLFSALVIYCAATGARPVPEYHSIGEVGPAMLETIIGALCFEHGTERARMIRELFNIRSGIAQVTSGPCLCFDHAQQFMRKASTEDPAALAMFDEGASAKLSAPQLCIQVVPPSVVDGSGASIAPVAFIASVQTSIDVCEKNCSSFRFANQAKREEPCDIPSVLGIEFHEQFGPIITIMTDDMIARGLTHPSTTCVYRRSPIGTIHVPREMSLLSQRDGTYHLATYRLVAQIIQEGGHFTAMMARRDGVSKETVRYAYASDRMISPLHDMTISPGCTALFYTQILHDPSPIVSPTHAREIMLRATCVAMASYSEMSRSQTITPSSGVTPQPLQGAQNINKLPPMTQELFREFYFNAINSHVALSIRTFLAPTGLEMLFKHKTSAKFADLIARALWKSPGRKFEDAHFAAWHFWSDPEIGAILRDDAEGDHIRVELEKCVRASLAPLTALAASRVILALPSARRDQILRAIEKYGGPAAIAAVAEVIATPSMATPGPSPSLVPTQIAHQRRAMEGLSEVEPRPTAPPPTILSPAYIPSSSAPGFAAPVASSGSSFNLAPAGSGEPIFPRRVSATANVRQGGLPDSRQGTHSRPPYITPELMFAYERMQSS